MYRLYLHFSKILFMTKAMMQRLQSFSLLLAEAECKTVLHALTLYGGAPGIARLAVSA